MKKTGFAAVLLVAGLLPKYAFASGHLNFISEGAVDVLIALFLVILFLTLLVNFQAFNIGFMSRKKERPVAPFLAGCVNSVWLFCLASGRDRFPWGAGLLFGSLIAMNVVAFVRTVS